MKSSTPSVPERQVAKTIFITDIDPSLNFSLVEYGDGRLGIFRNGAPISPGPWLASELHNCVSTFQKITRIAAQAAAARDGVGSSSRS
jgi:hypothetical protein